MQKKINGRFPHDATPDLHRFREIPESGFDVVERYGTYNIQPTADTENLFPLIAPGLPREWKEMRLGKSDLEREAP